jgi:hypothetical protein
MRLRSWRVIDWCRARPVSSQPVTLQARVLERRRAAALARHYRDEGGLSIREIARLLGRADATVKAYLYDLGGHKHGVDATTATVGIGLVRSGTGA